MGTTSAFPNAKSTRQNMGEAAKRGKEDKGIENFRLMKRLHISLTKINFHGLSNYI
jgi:hypothetical protein